MTFISRDEEIAMLANGEKPYSINGSTEFDVRDESGIPTGQYCRIYRVHPTTGLAAIHALSERTMTPEELDAVEMRGRDGTLLAMTYGEYRKRSQNDGVSTQ